MGKFYSRIRDGEKENWIKKLDEDDISLLAVSVALAYFCLPISTAKILGRGLYLYLGLILAVFLIIRTVAVKAVVRIKKYQYTAVFFLTYSLFSALWSPSFKFSQIFEFVKVFILVICLLCVQLTKKEKKLVALSYVLSGIITSLFILFGSGSIDDFYKRSTISVFGVAHDPNYICLIILVPIAFFLYWFFNSEKWYYGCLSIIGVSAMLYAVFLTGSRGGFVGCLCEIILGFIIFRKKKKLSVIIVVFIAILAIPAVIAILPHNLVSRFALSSIISGGGSGRIAIWGKAWQQIFDSPLKIIVGHGAGSSKYLIGIAAHNHILQILLEHGLIGLGFYVVFFISTVKYFIVKKSYCSLMIFAGAVVMSLTLSVQFIDYYWVTVAFCQSIDGLEPIPVHDEEIDEEDE